MEWKIYLLKAITNSLLGNYELSIVIFPLNRLGITSHETKVTSLNLPHNFLSAYVNI